MLFAHIALGLVPDAVELRAFLRAVHDQAADLVVFLAFGVRYPAGPAEFCALHSCKNYTTIRRFSQNRQ